MCKNMSSDETNLETDRPGRNFDFDLGTCYRDYTGGKFEFDWLQLDTRT